MQIELKLNKDFERALEDLKSEYGEEFEYLNGLHASQLNYSSFIDNFVDKDTVADASVDSSSNVHNKDIVTLNWNDVNTILSHYINFVKLCILV